GPGGSGGTATMRPGPGDTYLALVGPVDATKLATCGSYDLTVVIVARDTAGNETKRTATFGKAVRHCSP
ncbi:MAG: hypothetical protein ACRDSN_24780, partial [Pseudonocardiaceae bacterium]